MTNRELITEQLKTSPIWCWCSAWSEDDASNKVRRRLIVSVQNNRYLDDSFCQHNFAIPCDEVGRDE